MTAWQAQMKISQQLNDYDNSGDAEEIKRIGKKVASVLRADMEKADWGTSATEMQNDYLRFRAKQLSRDTKAEREYFAKRFEKVTTERGFQRIQGDLYSWADANKIWVGF